ncbi:hypothetical protein KFJ24_00175 [Marinobacter sediminum]|uniref:hypothetical protein n=1 Tax=Marinobacter sediminum TaxID=256323 RepID=UPI00202ECE00|nr:hypothetical protein [Marinobacter sediminum]MCM0610888.1 hypothetical protein [Marinobacter sediminum]
MRVKSGFLALTLVGLSSVFVSQAFALQDPTRPPGFGDAPVKAIPKTSLSLESILVGSKRRVAVINGEPRAEGQVFDGIRVRRIYRNRVEVVDYGRVRVLYLDRLPQVRGTQ